MSERRQDGHAAAGHDRALRPDVPPARARPQGRPAGAPVQPAPRRALHGVLLLDKPVGLSSNDALQQARRLYRAAKAGHTGTLDPLASGLLPLCFGAATKFSQAGLDADKAYRATLALGTTTTTGDAEGQVRAVRPVALDRAAIEAACAAFVGTIEQVPPMHSALKKDGRALYEYARAGVEIERAPRRVSLRRVDVVEWQDERLVIDVVCSKGTYIRTLAEDIGERLGCGAHLAALRRTANGPLRLDDAVTLAALAELDEPARDALLKPVDALLAGWPQVRLGDDDARRFLTGLRRHVDLPDTPAVRVHGPQPGAFLGTGHVVGGELVADRLLSPAEIAGPLESTP